MNKATNVLLLVTGMLTFFAGAAFQNAIIMGAGGAAFLFAIAMDHRRAKRSHEERRAAITQRINDLTSRNWPDEKSLAIPSNSAFMLAIGAPIALGSLVLAYASMSDTPRNWLIAALSLIVFLAFSVTISRAIATIGRPALVLRARGISSPLFGFIPWSEISGINLQAFSFRGQVTYTLVYRLNLSNWKDHDLHWTESILWALGLGVIRRGVVTIPLKEKSGGDYPETIAATSKYLWHQATGQSHDWNPMFSDGYNQASKRLSGLLTSKGLPQTAGISSPQQVLTAMELQRVVNDANTMRREHKKVASQLNWLIAIAAIASLISLAWPWLKPYIR